MHPVKVESSGNTITYFSPAFLYPCFDNPRVLLGVARCYQFKPKPEEIMNGNKKLNLDRNDILDEKQIYEINQTQSSRSSSIYGSWIEFAVKTILLIATVAGFVTWGVYRERKMESAEEQIATSRPVKVSKVKSLSIGPTMRFSAMTQSQQHVKISFAIGGRILSRPIQVGDVVKKGSLLAKIEPDPAFNAVEAQKAKLAELNARILQSQRDEHRMQTLVSSGAVTTSSLEKVNTSLLMLNASKDAAEAQLNEARRQFRESKITAPFNATVTAVFAEKGEMTAAGSPIAILDGKGGIEVEIEVPETFFYTVETGQSIDIALPLVDIQGIEGKIRSIGKSVSGPGGLFPIIISIENDDRVRAGMIAEVHLPTGIKSEKSVPVSAILNPTGKSATVFKVVNGKTKKIAVKTYDIIGDKVLVEGDLSEGDWIITEGHQQLSDDATVEVKQ
jgi:RND family efflux transporter MFP subunit